MNLTDIINKKIAESDWMWKVENRVLWRIFGEAYVQQSTGIGSVNGNLIVEVFEVI